jgi:hypothetical protein
VENPADAFSAGLASLAAMEMTFEALVKVLQASISPVAMVSGVGLLLLSLTNRFARVTDRIRELVAERRSGLANPHVDKQIEIFHRRARGLRSAITAAIACMFMASIMVLVLFAIAVFGAHAHWMGLMLLAGSVVFLVLSLFFFLMDMRLALMAIEEELQIR